MNPVFEVIEEISKEQFIAAWEAEEQSAKHVFDKFADDRLNEHRQYTRLKYYVGTLAEDGFDRLILPHHTHGSCSVKTGGDLFKNVISIYAPKFQARIVDACLNRLCDAVQELSDLFSKSGNLLTSYYTLGRIYDDPELAMPNVYISHGDSKLYAGNFHRFVAYGLWVKEVGYQPVKVYYCREED